MPAHPQRAGSGVHACKSRLRTSQSHPTAIATPTAISASPAATCVRFIATGSASQRRARAKSAAQPRLPSERDRHRDEADHRDVEGGEPPEVEEAGQHAHVEQDRLRVAGDHHQPGGEARERALPRRHAGRRPHRRRLGLADQAAPPSRPGSPRRRSAAPSGTRPRRRSRCRCRAWRGAARPRPRPPPRRRAAPPPARRRSPLERSAPRRPAPASRPGPRAPRRRRGGRRG